MNEQVATYLRTTENWHDELVALREILVGAGLAEDFKWKKPVYTYEGANVSVLFRYKAFCALGFLKGALLDDPEHVLVAPGANSRAMRQIRVTTVAEIERLAPVIRAYVAAAVQIEKEGRRIEFDNSQIAIPAELEARFDELPKLRAAFEALTPGRRRGYAIHIGSAKRAETREARVDACVQPILDGKGLNDR